MPDFSDQPVRPAATVLVVDDRPDLHVLMMRRTRDMVFGPDAWVFPGGRVDDADHQGGTAFTGLSDQEASAQLGVAGNGLSWWGAACRETLEEAGLVLGLSAAEGPVDVGAMRASILADPSSFYRLLSERGLRLEAGALEQVARFITPMGAPRRYDTQFFLAVAPEGQVPIHDDDEIVAWEWMRPGEALERRLAGEIDIMTPTIRMLACLARFETSIEVMGAARKRLPYQRVRVVDPKGRYEVVLPGDEGYDGAELEVESGWVRLWEAP